MRFFAWLYIGAFGLVMWTNKLGYFYDQSFAKKQALGEVSQDILETQVNPAVWEISGHIVLKQRKDFDDASEAYAWRLLAEVSLSEEMFQEVKDCVLEAAGGSRKDEVENKEEEGALHKPILPESASHLSQDCLVLQRWKKS